MSNYSNMIRKKKNTVIYTVAKQYCCNYNAWCLYEFIKHNEFAQHNATTTFITIKKTKSPKCLHRP